MEEKIALLESKNPKIDGRHDDDTNADNPEKEIVAKFHGSEEENEKFEGQKKCKVEERKGEKAGIESNRLRDVASPASKLAKDSSSCKSKYSGGMT